MLQSVSRITRNGGAKSARRPRRRFAPSAALARLFDPLEARTLLSVAPIGLVDVFNTITISGWAYDADDGSTPISVEFNINGTKTTIHADVTRPDLALTLPSTNHAFSFSVPNLAPGTSKVTITAISSTGERKVIKTGTLINPVPIGKVELLTASTIRGWAYDSDSTSPLFVRVDVDGVQGSPFQTNVVRDDLAAKYGVQNLGFELPGSYAGHAIAVYAYDAPSGVPKLIFTNNLAAKGKVEVSNGLVVTGWAQDPNSPTSSISVRIAIDGVMLPGAPIAANITRNDLVKTLLSSDHGFSVALPTLTPGKHTIAVYALDGQLSAAAPVLIGQTVLNTAAITGLVDTFNTTTVSGWAFSRDDGAAPLNIEITVNGVKTMVVADQIRSDLASTLLSPYHGFTFSLPSLPAGVTTVTVVAISPTTGARMTLKTGILSKPAPIGKIELFTPTEISGWAFDADAGGPIQVRVDVDGVHGTPFTTNVARADLAVKYGVANLGFDVTGNYAGHVVEVFGIDSPSGADKLLFTNNKAPKGKLELVNGTTITGWAIDPDSPTFSSNVLVTIDGTTLNGTPTPADVTRNDLLLTLGSANHGFNITIPGLTPGPHVIAVYALDSQASSAAPVLLGKKAVVNNPPIGKIETITGLQITGWALDPDLKANSSMVNVYVDDALFTTVIASEPRTALLAKYGSANHGFTVNLSSLPAGSHSITVTVMDDRISDQNEVVFYDGFINNSVPTGSFDSVDGTVMRGWAYDPDAGPNPIDVDIYVDGVYRGTSTADQPNTDLGVALPSPNHAFTIDLPTLSFGTHTIDVYAAESQGNVSVLIGSKTVTNNRPVGLLESATSSNVTGWALDPDRPGESLTIQVWINGVLAQTQTADAVRTDLIGSPLVTGGGDFVNYGFNIPISGLSAGTNYVDVYAVDKNNGQLSLIGSKILTV